MTAAYLAKLNTEQRRAVEHGCGALDGASPLLIIAGAGSGKTNTLANRVAHLIVSGADPRRMMLLTFSRRAAGLRRRAMVAPFVLDGPMNATSFMAYLKQCLAPTLKRGDPWVRLGERAR